MGHPFAAGEDDENSVPLGRAPDLAMMICLRPRLRTGAHVAPRHAGDFSSERGAVLLKPEKVLDLTLKCLGQTQGEGRRGRAAPGLEHAQALAGGSRAVGELLLLQTVLVPKLDKPVSKAIHGAGCRVGVTSGQVRITSAKENILSAVASSEQLDLDRSDITSESSRDFSRCGGHHNVERKSELVGAEGVLLKGPLHWLLGDRTATLESRPVQRPLSATEGP